MDVRLGRLGMFVLQLLVLFAILHGMVSKDLLFFTAHGALAVGYILLGRYKYLADKRSCPQ